MGTGDQGSAAHEGEPLRLLHVLYGGMGGIGAYFMEFVTSDRHERFRHEALFYGIEPVYPDYREFCEQHGIPYSEIVKRRGLDLPALFRLHRALASPADAVILHTSSGAPPALARRLVTGVPLVHVEHSPVAAKTPLERLTCRVLRRWADRTVLFYPSHRAELDGPDGGLRDEQCVLIPKIPDLAFFRPASEPRSGEPLRIGMQARLSTYKDHPTLIRAMALVRERLTTPVSLHLAGDGDERPALEALTDELGLGEVVTFHGRLRRRELLEFLQGLDVYVHATCGETLCYAIMEAQACGLPIVASDVRGVREGIVHGGTGLLFPHQDAQTLASQLAALAQDPKERRRLGKASRDHVEALASRSSTAEAFHAAIRGLNPS